MVLIRVAKDGLIRYRTLTIITHGLHIFYPIFHCGLYCRAVYNAERLIFHDTKAAVYAEEWFVLQETFLSLKIRVL